MPPSSLPLAIIGSYKNGCTPSGSLSSPDLKEEHSYENARELSLEDSEELELPVSLYIAIAIDLTKLDAR